MSQHLVELEGFEKAEEVKDQEQVSLMNPDDYDDYEVDQTSDKFFNPEDYDKPVDRYELIITVESEPETKFEVDKDAKPTLWMNKKKKMTLVAKPVAMASYIGFLWIASMFIGYRDPNIRYHIKQGMRLSLVELGAAALINIIFQMTRFTMNLLELGSMITWMKVGLYLIAGTYFIMLSLKGVVNALMNKQKPLPGINKYFYHLEHIKIVKNKLVAH